MEVAARIRRVRRTLRRHERTAVAAYLMLLAAALVLTCTPALRGPLLEAAERVTRASSQRWALRVEGALQALDDARAMPDPLRREELLDRVAARLEALDLRHPAPTVEFARDKERVRLLRALVATYTAADRKGRALDAVRRLVAFDPRRYESHLLHARTAQAFGEPEEAWLAYEAVLAIHPNHLPSVGARIAMRADEADWAAATALFEAYLAAHWLAPVEVRLGDGAVGARHVPVDGALHALDLPLAPPRTVAPEERVTVVSPEVAVEQAAVELVPALRAGAPERPAASGAAPVARVQLRVRLRKPVGAVLWEVVARSYRNQLAWDALEAARARVRIEPEPAS